VRYPYERFIRFLVSRKLDPSDTLNGYGLPHVGPMWTSDCRHELRKTAPSAIVNYIDSKNDHLTFKNGVLEWAEDEGFRELWDAQPEFSGKTDAKLDTAHLIFMNPHSRALTGMMILSKASDDEICLMVKEKLGLELDEEGLGIYCDIFWDVDILGREGWEAFLSEIKTKEERHYLALGLGALSLDECRNTAGLGTHLDLDMMLHAVLSESFFKLRAAYNHPNPEAANIEMWHSHWQRAWDRAEKRRREEDGENPIASGDFEALFSIRTTKSEHVSLTDLKGHMSTGAEIAKEKG